MQDVVLVFVVHVQLLQILIQIGDAFLDERLRLAGQDCLIYDDGAA